MRNGNVGVIDIVQDLGSAYGDYRRLRDHELRVASVLQPDQHRESALLSTIIAVVAIGQAFVILVAGIDLSVGAVLALASVVGIGLPLYADVPVWLAAFWRWPPAALVGLINGLNVTITQIPALIATLAMLTIARGIAFIYSGGQNIAPVPSAYVEFQGTTRVWDSGRYCADPELGVVAHFVLTKTRFGRARSTPPAAIPSPPAWRASGRTGNHCRLCDLGLAAALGGLMISARLEAGAATAGQGLELTVISAVVIGGVSLFGGEGKIGGVLLGVLLLALVQNAINLLNVPPNYDYVVSGLVIGVARRSTFYRRRYVEAGLRRRTIAKKGDGGGPRKPPEMSDETSGGLEKAG
jgi:ribose transport system permease protein